MPDFLKALDNIGSMMGGTSDFARYTRNAPAVEQAARNLLLGGANAIALGDMPMIDPNLGVPRPPMGGNFLPTEMQSDYLYSPSAMNRYLDYANKQNWAYNSAPEYKDVPLWMDPSAPAVPIDEWATQTRLGKDNVEIPNVLPNKRAKKNEGK